MNLFNDTNKKRVQKIVEIIHLLRKSGAANGADREHMWDLLEPAINELGEAIGEDPQKPQPNASQTLSEPVSEEADSPAGNWAAPKDAPAWASIRDVAANAPLKDLGPAMALILNRIEEEVLKKS